jgi:hypothetical protein
VTLRLTAALALGFVLRDEGLTSSRPRKIAPGVIFRVNNIPSIKPKALVLGKAYFASLGGDSLASDNHSDVI